MEKKQDDQLNYFFDICLLQIERVFGPYGRFHCLELTTNEKSEIRFVKEGHEILEVITKELLTF